MYFNFPLFSRLARRAYHNVQDDLFSGCPYSMEDILSVFRYYFQKYEDTFDEVHPNIRVSQIEYIIEVMPYIGNDGNSSAGGDINAESYEALIDKHFQTKYQNCDFNINHFFAGDIRLMRFYEELY